MKSAFCIFVLWPAVGVLAATAFLRPVNNTFVLSPGIACPLPDANDLNFGGSGSLCVSSPIARAYDPLQGIDHPPKGEFITLLKFDASVCSETTISALVLKLAITCGNQSAGGIFNYLGSPGDFDLYWVDNAWQQGYGTPLSPADPNAGITYTGLMSLLDQTDYVYLETLYYNAQYPYSAGENWFEFELNLEKESYAGLKEAVESGETITFMLLAPMESASCFNIRAYIQYAPNGSYTIRNTGPVLKVQAAIPFSHVDFDKDGRLTISDLIYITDFWLQTGDALVADLAPLGGDGIVNMLDFCEFAQFW